MFCLASHVKLAGEDPQDQAFVLPVLFSAPLLPEQMVALAWNQHSGSPAPHTQPHICPQHAQLQTQCGSSKWHSPKGIPASFSLGFIRRKKGITPGQGKMTTPKASLGRAAPEGGILSLQSAANNLCPQNPQPSAGLCE